MMDIFRKRKVIQEGTIEVDVQRGDKHYVAGKNQEKKKIFIEITDNNGNSRRLVKPFMGFFGYDTTDSILRPFVEMAKRGIPFNDEDYKTYQDQFERFTRERKIRNPFSVKDSSLVDQIAQELGRLGKKAEGVVVIPEIDFNGGLGHVKLQHAHYRIDNKSPPYAFCEIDHEGFRIVAEKIKGQDRPVTLSDAEIYFSQYSPEKRMLSFFRLSQDPIEQISDAGGMGIDGFFVEQTYLPAKKVAMWYVNKAELGIVPKERFLDELRRIK